MTYYNKIIEDAALDRGYIKSDIDAAFEYFNRKERNSHPPGRFDNAGRFYAEERTERVENVRAPSGRFPYSEMTAARTAEHCAEVYGATPLHVKRIYDAIKKVNLLPAREDKILLKMKRPPHPDIAEYRPEKLKNVSVTKPAPKKPVISDKKPFNPLKEITSFGFKTARMAKLDGSAEVVSAYRVDDGYIILAPESGVSLPLAAHYSLTFIKDLSDPAGKEHICELERSLGKDSFMQSVESAVSKYTTTQSLHP